VLVVHCLILLLLLLLLQLNRGVECVFNSQLQWHGHILGCQVYSIICDFGFLIWLVELLKFFDDFKLKIVSNTPSQIKLFILFLKLFS
jgi:hypothetical protein